MTYLSSANINFLKTKLSKIIQPGRFLGRLLGILLRVGLPLMKKALQSLAKSLLAKSLLIRLGLTTTVSATDT